MPAPDVVVIGGGIIGLSVARELILRGARVTVIERRTCGAEASGAAAGMLAPLAESAFHGLKVEPESGVGSFLELAMASLEAHPPWLERLRAETGIDAGPFGPGMLWVAAETGLPALRAAFERHQASGLPLEWLDEPELRAAEPALAFGSAAVRSPRERHVQPPLVVQALARSLTAFGGSVSEGMAATGFVTRGDRVLAVRAGGGEMPCGEVVIAGGAWTPAIAAELTAAVAIEPIRGQILALRPGASVGFRHTIYTAAGYMVPKPDGRLVVGATEDQAGFDARPVVRGVAALLELATRLSPPLAAAPFDGAWAGLRPASADRLPLLGPLPGWENVSLATGHHRNGVLLAPITGKLLADWVLDGRADPLMAPFLPCRQSSLRSAKQSGSISVAQ